MKTEEEAKKLWCPHVRQSKENMGTFNRWNKFEPPKMPTTTSVWNDTGKLDSECCCIASRCMMWQWGAPESRPSIETVRTGYCGLGGKP